MKFYQPLSNAELLELGNVLKISFEMDEKGKINPIKAKREQKQFWRDIEMVSPMVQRKNKPKKVKRYVKDSYLDIVLKSSGPQEAKKWESLHSDSIVVTYDSVTSEKIAKEKNIPANLVRQAKRRLNLLAKSLYNHSLEE